MLKKISLFRDVFMTLLFVFVIFTPPVRFLPYYSWILALIGIWTMTDRNFRFLIGFKDKKNLNFLKSLAFVLIFNAVAIPLSHISGDFTYVPLQIGIVLAMFRNILLVYCLHRFGKGDIFELYCKYFFLSCCIYVAFTLIFIFEPGFKHFWLDTMLTSVEDKSLDFAVYEFRYSLDGFAAFSSASVFSFSCLFCSYLIASSKEIKLYKIICLMLMVVGCFFYGRVSLVGMLLGAVLIVWTSGSLLKTLRIISIIVALVLGLLALLNIASKSNDSLILWQEWAFSIVKQIFVERAVSDYSVTHMVEDMYYMPDFSTLLFGDGLYTNSNGSYYGHTDVGFMRLILYGGILSLFLVYYLMIKVAKITAQVSKTIVFKRFMFLTIILFFALEMKGEAYQREIMMVYPLFLILNYKNNILKHYE